MNSWRFAPNTPPLPVLLRSLKFLRDLRLATDRGDIATRHADLNILCRAVTDGG